MTSGKQVDSSHYEFGPYVDKARWASLWHQLDELIRLRPSSVLEVGPGPGLLKSIAAILGISVETIDHDPDLHPDFVGSVTALPFENDSYDVVCAFQVLEHLPYPSAVDAFRELTRVSRGTVLISLPDARPVWRFCFTIPLLGSFDFSIQRPILRRPIHKFVGEHHWEIENRGYGLEKVGADLSQHCPLARTYRVPENPYHRFMVFQKR